MGFFDRARLKQLAEPLAKNGNGQHLMRKPVALITPVPTSIPNVLIFEPQVFGDKRGFLLVSFDACGFRNAIGANVAFVQDNHSRSRRNVLRGLHYQIRRLQGKFVHVVTGRVFEVGVDLRKSSPSLGRIELSADDHRMPWIPPGFAHGLPCSRTPPTPFTKRPTTTRPSMSGPSRGMSRRSALTGRWKLSRCCRR